MTSTRNGPLISTITPVRSPSPLPAPLSHFFRCVGQFYLSDRPFPRADRDEADWLQRDFKVEVRRAISQGLDGFHFEYMGFNGTDVRWHRYHSMFLPSFPPPAPLLSVLDQLIINNCNCSYGCSGSRSESRVPINSKVICEREQ